jgi:8-amino-7-oxononanoate synthase
MSGGTRIAHEELAALEAQGLLRSLEPLRTPASVEVELDGPRGAERLVSFSSNDYLGLAAHPEVRAALAEGAQRWGTGAGASRLVSGDYLPHRELESELAVLEGTESCLLFNSGYAANCGIVPALVSAADAVFSDELNHASLVDACRLSRARVHVYPHGEVAALAEALRAARAAGARRLLVATDTVFSMDGDLCPLREIAQLCEEREALLLLDEAHATGVLGPRGAGLAAALGVADKADVRMGTLSKAAGVLGAYAASSAPVRALLLNRARPFIFSTALPPAVACAALAAVRLLAGPEGDRRRARLFRSVARFAAGLRELGLEAEERSPIFPIIFGAPDQALRAASALREKGLLVKAIRPPTVPQGTSRLRFALSADHSDAHLEQALSALRETL